MDNTKTTWGYPYAEVSPIGKEKYAKLLRRLVILLVVFTVIVLLSTLTYIVFKLTTTDFEVLVFDDGTPVKCVLSSSSDRPIPSVIYQPVK